jgi:hypothetical protein
MLGFELIKVRLGPAAANCSKATSADRFLHSVEDLVPGEGLLGRQIGHGLNFNASASNHEAGGHRLLTEFYRKNVAAPKRSSYIAIANASVLQFNY